MRPRIQRGASLLGLTALTMLCAAGTVHAQARAYRGPHPIDLDGHWDLEDAVHVHGELSVGFDPFGDVDGILVFLADPLAYGYQGEVWTFRGAHPLPGGLPGYCGIDGDHRHPFAPEGSFRRGDDGVYAYVGAMRGGIEMVRPGRVMPRHPIVSGALVARPPSPGTLAPFYWGGCMHQWIWGSASRPAAVPYAGCVPTTPFVGTGYGYGYGGYGHAGRAGVGRTGGRPTPPATTPRPPPAPPVESTVYSRVTSRPLVAPSRGRPPQRNRP